MGESCLRINCCVKYEVGFVFTRVEEGFCSDQTPRKRRRCFYLKAMLDMLKQYVYRGETKKDDVDALKLD